MSKTSFSSSLMFSDSLVVDSCLFVIRLDCLLLNNYFSQIKFISGGFGVWFGSSFGPLGFIFPV